LPVGLYALRAPSLPDRRKRLRPGKSSRPFGYDPLRKKVACRFIPFAALHKRICLTLWQNIFMVSEILTSVTMEMKDGRERND
jgi:hypothetical protein